MRIKKIILAVVAFLAAFQAYSQTTQDAAFDKLYSALSDSCLSIKCTYTLTMSEMRISGEAELLAQDGCYVMETGEISVYCDGTSVWTIDNSVKEVVIEPGPGGYDLTKVRDVKLGQNGMIDSFSFVHEDGTVMKAKVVTMTSSEKKSFTSFRPQMTFGSDWIVTDMR